MKYNIIGDIHGRTSWKELVIEDGINIFVGDYFSPYHSEYTFNKCMQTLTSKDFSSILNLKPAIKLLVWSMVADP